MTQQIKILKMKKIITIFSLGLFTLGYHSQIIIMITEEVLPM